MDGTAMTLIERLEAATGPSFALDTEIFCAVTGRVQISDIPGYTITEPNDGTLLKAPPYTTSLDAALQLVREGWWLTGCGEQRSPIVYANDIHEPSGSFYAKVQHVKGGRLQIATGRSLALALCIAALRARGNG